MAPPPVVRPAVAADLLDVADALAQAFADDPVMTWLFGTPAARVERSCRRFFGRIGRRHHRNELVFTTDDRRAGAYWDPPGRWKLGPVDLVRLAPVVTLAVGPRIPRALRGLGRIDAVHDRFPDHYYLAYLGTAPDRQGTGCGSALLRPVLDRCDTDGVGAFLESSKAANLPFYERHGFRVVEELPLPGGPSIWPMWRDPQPPRPRPADG